MNAAARRYARRILLINGLLLVAILVVVGVAGNRLYVQARELAVRKVEEDQRRSALQTTRTVELFFTSITRPLDLLGRVEGNMAGVPMNENGEAPPPGQPRQPRGVNPRQLIMTAVWDQLQDRTSHLIGYDIAAQRIFRSFNAAGAPQPQAIVDAIPPGFLERSSSIDIVDRVRIDQSDYTLLTRRPADRPNIVFISAVPLDGLYKQIFEGFNRPGQYSAFLLGSDAKVVLAPEFDMAGLDARQMPALRVTLQRIARLPANSTARLPLEIDEDWNETSLATVQRVSPVAGHEWQLVVRSNLRNLDAAVSDTFATALTYGGLLAALILTVLISTAWRMIRNRTMLERERHKDIDKELAQARQIQLSWMPRDTPSEPDIDIAGLNTPASHVSGDFYNWFTLEDGRYVVLVGDVTGHGLAAAFLMATTQLLVRSELFRHNDPGKALTEVNRQLCQQSHGGQFVTMLVVVISADRRTMSLVGVGHPPPLMWMGDRFEQLKMEPELVLGVEEDIEYIAQDFELPEKTGIVLFTDGVTEALAESGDRFSEEQFCDSLDGCDDCADKLLERAHAAVNKFRGQQVLADDLTLVAICINAPVAQEVSGGV